MKSRNILYMAMDVFLSQPKKWNLFKLDNRDNRKLYEEEEIGLKFSPEELHNFSLNLMLQNIHVNIFFFRKPTAIFVNCFWQRIIQFEICR